MWKSFFHFWESGLVDGENRVSFQSLTELSFFFACVFVRTRRGASRQKQFQFLGVQTEFIIVISCKIRQTFAVWAYENLTSFVTNRPLDSLLLHAFHFSAHHHLLKFCKESYICGCVVVTCTGLHFQGSREKAKKINNTDCFKLPSKSRVPEPSSSTSSIMFSRSSFVNSGSISCKISFGPGKLRDWDKIAKTSALQNATVQ